MTVASTSGGRTSLEWIKSSYSTDEGPDCVEVAIAEGVFVRDSKKPTGRRLALTPAAWAAFLPYAAKR